MAKIAPAALAMVFEYPQVQGHHLVALAGVLHGPPAGRLDPQIRVLAVLAGRTAVGLGPDLDTSAARYPYNLQAGYAYNGSCVGHRYSLH